MTESERCELVLNAVFYWEPVEFFQKRCDMIMLGFFQDEPRGVVLDGDSPECKKCGAAEATDVLFHGQCLSRCTPRYVTVV